MGPVSIGIEVQRNTNGDIPSNATFTRITNYRVCNLHIYLYIDSAPSHLEQKLAYSSFCTTSYIEGEVVHVKLVFHY